MAPRTRSTRGNAPRPDASISSKQSLEYWNSIPASVSGMLGDYPQVSRIDLQGSAGFLAKLRRKLNPSVNASETTLLKRAVDCGAGIGRITKGFLLGVADVVDVVEPVTKFTDQLSLDEKEASALDGSKPRGKIGDIFNVGLEDWNPTAQTQAEGYNLIWNQWCLGHLKDADLVAYLGRCITALANGGWIVVKENMSTEPDGTDVYDDLDSSVTRTDESFRIIFRKAGLKIVATELQRGFPRSLGLYPVRSYALQPIRER